MIDYQLWIYILLGLGILAFIGYYVDKQTDRGIRKFENLVKNFKEGKK